MIKYNVCLLVMAVSLITTNAFAISPPVLSNSDADASLAAYGSPDAITLLDARNVTAAKKSFTPPHTLRLKVISPKQPSKYYHLIPFSTGQKLR